MSSCEYCLKQHYVFFIVKMLNTYYYTICYDCYWDGLQKKLTRGADKEACQLTPSEEEPRMALLSEVDKAMDVPIANMP